jgi:hypothetical protein
MSSKQDAHSASEGWTQDKAGWGMLGMTVGILAAYFLVFYFLIPLFPKDKATLNVTLMTTLVTAAMTIGGALGYLALRRKA